MMLYIRTLEQPLPAGMSKPGFDVLVGKEIYRQYRIGCHGEKGDGNTALGHAQVPRAPEISVMPRGRSRLGQKELAQAIAHGKPGTAMMPWTGILNPEDIRRVTLFIRQTYQHQP